MPYYVYILANERPTLYIGVTNNLIKRVWEHKKEIVEGFTKKYHVHKLVYYEEYNSIILAIKREKTLKKFRRKQKLNLIRKINPKFYDVYEKLCE